VGGINLFLYTNANPINFIDPLGLYNRDVHYDLTKQLATEAGFKSCAADIAGADQGVDDNPETDGWKSERNRELWHFPSQARVNEVINNALSSCSIKDLGKALHVLQDSFSHAGYGPKYGHFPDPRPDIPKYDWNKYINMSTATRNLLKEFSQRCASVVKCCK